MEKLTIKEFKKENNIEIIQKLMKINNGYITSKIITELGIHRMYLNIMVEKKMIEKVGKGIYIDISNMEDTYYIFSLETPKVIYSHMTALYFHGLSIIAPNDKYDISVPKKYYNSKIKKHNVFYRSSSDYELGIIEVKTPMGNEVKCYDIEKCICDIIKYRKRMDMEHVKYSIKEYLKRKDKNMIKLSEYSEKMGIRDEVMEFISVMYD